MEFPIQIMHDRKRYRFKVQQLPSDPSFDYYKVIGKNGSITFRNNAPVMRRHKLKYRPPEWRVHENDLRFASFKEAIIKALNAYLKTL